MQISFRKRSAKKKQRQAEKTIKQSRRKKPALSALQLPEDILGGTARLTLISNARALVENHRGIVQITEESVKLMTRQGVLTIIGRGLSLSEVRPDALSIVGEIAGVELPARAASLKGGADDE